MVKIELFVPASGLSPVTETLQDLGYDGLTVTEVSTTGEAPSPALSYRGRDFTPMRQGLRLEVVVPARRLEEALEQLGHVMGRDGRILVTPVSEVVRIRTGERGADAIGG